MEKARLREHQYTTYMYLFGRPLLFAQTFCCLGATVKTALGAKGLRVCSRLRGLLGRICVAEQRGLPQEQLLAPQVASNKPLNQSLADSLCVACSSLFGSVACLLLPVCHVVAGDVGVQICMYHMGPRPPVEGMC